MKTIKKRNMKSNRKQRHAGIALPGIASMLLIITVVPFPLFAYIDPGSGSFFFQIAVSSVLGIIFTLKSKFGKKQAIAKDEIQSEDP